MSRRRTACIDQATASATANALHTAQGRRGLRGGAGRGEEGVWQLGPGHIRQLGKHQDNRRNSGDYNGNVKKRQNNPIRKKIQKIR